jgi:hypothetical protein
MIITDNYFTVIAGMHLSELDNPDPDPIYFNPVH